MDYILVPQINKDKNKEFNLSTPIYSIINDIIDKSCNKITEEIYIKERYTDYDTRIICSYEKYIREWNSFHPSNNKDIEFINKNENQIKIIVK